MMGYIVDLTVILHRLFISAHDVSASEVQATMDLHVRSGLREQIHGDICRFVTVLDSLPHRGNDLAMEKIIDLIKQFCVPPLSLMYFSSAFSCTPTSSDFHGLPPLCEPTIHSFTTQHADILRIH